MISECTGAAEMGKPKYLSGKLMAALGAYFILLLIATLALDGIIRTGVYFFFAILTVRTLIAARHDLEERQGESDDAPVP